MHLFLTIAAGLVFIGVGLMAFAIFNAKPDPNEKEGFNEEDTYNSDVYNFRSGNMRKVK